MKSRHLLVLLAVAALLTVTAYFMPALANNGAAPAAAPAAPAAAPTARPVKIAVVDVVKVFDGLREKVDIEGKYRTRQTKLQNDDVDKQKEIEKQKDALDRLLGMVDRNNPTAVEAFDKFQKTLMEYKVWVQVERGKLVRDQALDIENLYKKMVKTIGKVAGNSGYDMVLFKETDINLSEVTSAEALPMMIQTRKVLWVTNDLDITSLISQTMNNEYVNTKASPATSVPTTQPTKPG